MNYLEPLFENYTTNAEPTDVDPYGTIILCRKSLSPSFSVTDLPSRMGRKLMVTHIPGGVTIGSVHFESLANEKLRQQQLKICNSLLNKVDNLNILVGDFNFYSYRNFNGRGPLENRVLGEEMPGFIDAWEEKVRKMNGSENKEKEKEKDKGYTFDTDINEMLTDSHPHERMRYDRVMYFDRTATNSNSNSNSNSEWSLEFFSVSSSAAARNPYFIHFNTNGF